MDPNAAEPRPREESGSRADESGTFFDPALFDESEPSGGDEPDEPPDADADADAPRRGPVAKPQHTPITPVPNSATASSSTPEARASISSITVNDVEGQLGTDREETVAALERSNALLFVVAAVSASAFTLTELISGQFADLGTSYLLLVITAGLAWTAYALRERGHQQLWTGAISVTAVACVVLAIGGASLALGLSGILLVLLWAALLLRPHWCAALAVYAVLMLLALGDSAVSLTDGSDYAVPALASMLLVPIGLSATLELRQRTLETIIAGTFTRLERQSEELEARLQNKVDELERSREQLFDAQKLKTVGTMAAGLAHELNNILTPIRGHAELIAEDQRLPVHCRSYGQRILDSAAAAATITGGLLTYTRQTTFQPVRTNLRQLLQSSFPVILGGLGSKIQIESEALDPTVSVDIDRILFQQAIYNLVLNAAAAMPNGGQLEISLVTSSSPVHSDDKPEDREGLQRSARLTISDTGTGIDDEHIDQIFDPFFTTKSVGSGSGLGLAVVMGTITRHAGRVLVDSTLDQGTTFTIILPLAVPMEAGANQSKPWPVLRDDANGPVVMVLTEDQDALDEYEELLEATECSPICTGDPVGAKSTLLDVGDQVDLLILDLELETTSAARLFKSVRELYPKMPVILISDQPTDPSVQQMTLLGPTRSVRKPMDNRLFSALLTDLLQPNAGYVRDFTPVPITINPGADVSGPHQRA